MRGEHPESFSWFGPELSRSQEALAREGDFWSGQDVVSETTEIGAGQSNPTAKKINLRLNRENLPNIDEFSLSTLHLLRTSIRSCYAQVGIDVRPDITKLTENDIKRVIQGEEINCPAVAFNYSRRATELSGGLFRFFWLDAKKHLIGDKLAEAVRKIKIQGEEGKDWFLGEAGEEGAQLLDGTVTKETPITLGLRIKETRLWVPFASKDEPVQVRSKKDLPKYLQSVPEGLTPDFMICETVPVHFPENLVGVINLGMHDEGGMHSGSPLIDPGFNGPIRLEIIKPGQHPDFVELLMYEHTPQNTGSK